MRDILKDSIRVVDSVSNWREAVTLGAKTLLEQGKVEKKYVDAMIRNIETLGPYVVIMPKVAMPHARPEDGVNETGLSLLKINNGVSFAEDKEDVKVLFTLAAKDSSSHIDTIMKLTDLLDDENKLESIFAAENSESIMELL